MSDTAVGQIHGLEVPQKETIRKESHRDRDRDRSNQFMGLSKKSNSTSQLSATGTIFFLFCNINIKLSLENKLYVLCSSYLNFPFVLKNKNETSKGCF